MTDDPFRDVEVHLTRIDGRMDGLDTAIKTGDATNAALIASGHATSVALIASAKDEIKQDTAAVRSDIQRIIATTASRERVEMLQKVVYGLVGSISTLIIAYAASIIIAAQR